MKSVIGHIDSSENHVSIWGAGFAGLVMGYYLKKQGYKITIYEKSNKVGGKIQTKKTKAGLVEAGANAIYLNADCIELLMDLKLEPLPAAKKLKRYLMINGSPKRPFQLGFLSKVAVNLYKKPPLVTDGLTVADFFRPLMGNANIDRFLSPALFGLYATPAEALHFKSIFHQVGSRAQFNSYWSFIKLIYKEMKEKSDTPLSGSVSFDGGMHTLIERLAEYLKSDIKFNYKEDLKLNGNTIICTDAKSASELTLKLKPEISLELGRIQYQEITSVTVFLKREIKSLNKAFGALIPLEDNYNSIGVLNNKAIFPSNNENVSSYTLISRREITKEEVLHDLRLLSSEIGPDDVEHMEFSHWEQGLPIYNLQLFLATKRLRQLIQNERELAIFGNYVAGISLREMVSAAKSFAASSST